MLLWGRPASLLSDNGLKFCSKLLFAVYKLLGMQKIATSAHHPNGNGGVERLNHIVAQILAMVVNERQDDWTSTCHTWNMLTTIPSAPPPGWPQMKCI